MGRWLAWQNHHAHAGTPFHEKRPDLDELLGEHLRLSRGILSNMRDDHRNKGHAVSHRSPTPESRDLARTAMLSIGEASTHRTAEFGARVSIAPTAAFNTQSSTSSLPSTTNAHQTRHSLAPAHLELESQAGKMTECRRPFAILPCSGKIRQREQTTNAVLHLFLFPVFSCRSFLTSVSTS